MPSEWIRPDGCEGGACVEYHVDGASVRVRNSAAPERTIGFTRTEWDTFVAGLTAEADAKCQRMLELAGLRGTERDRLAAENARLRQHLEAERESYGRLALKLDDVASERDRALASFESLEKTTSGAINGLAAETSRADSAWGTAQAWHGQWVRAQAEAEVLRHRDRRTQAVVDAAKALADVREALEPLKIAALTPVIDLLLAVDAYEKGPTEPPTSPLPAEQAPVVQSTGDGLEAQGGARRDDEAIPRAITRDWMAHLGYEPDEILAAEAAPDHSLCGYRPDPGQICRDEEDRDLHPAHTDLAESAELVMFVLDSPHLNRPVPLTEVLPEPAAPPVTKVVGLDPDAVQGNAEAGRAGEAQELPAVRRGVWHTGRSWQGHLVEDECPCPKQPCGLVNLAAAVPECTQHPMSRVKTMRQGHRAEDCPGPSDADWKAMYDKHFPGEPPAQDRTEGLDAAIEAAVAAAFPAQPGPMTLVEAVEAAVRAASPLIERAALHAAANRMEGRGYSSDSAVAWLRLWADGKTV